MRWQNVLGLGAVLCSVWIAFPSLAQTETPEPAVVYQLERVRFASQPQQQLPNPYVTAVLDIRATNKTKQALWFNAAAESVTPFPYSSDGPVPNVVAARRSAGGSSWRAGGGQHISDSSERVKLLPNQSLRISLRHEVDLRDDAAAVGSAVRFIKVGIPLGLQKGSPATVVWSSPIDVSPQRLLSELDIAPKNTPLQVVLGEQDFSRLEEARNNASGKYAWGKLADFVSRLDSAVVITDKTGRSMAGQALKLKLHLPRDADLDSVAIAAFPEITSAYIYVDNSSFVKPELIDRLAELPALDELTIRGTLSLDTWLAITKLPRIRSVAIADCRRLLDVGEQPSKPFEMRLPDSLRDVSFENTVVPRKILEGILHHDSLESFAVERHSIGLTAADYTALGKLKRLRRLELEGVAPRGTIRSLLFEINRKGQIVERLEMQAVQDVLSAGESEARSQLPTLRVSGDEFHTLVAGRSESELKDLGADWLEMNDAGSEGVLKVESPMESMTLPAKTLRAYRLDAEKSRVLVRVLKRFPEITNVHLAHQDTVTKVPPSVVGSLCTLPVLESLSFFASDQLEWTNDSMKSLSRLTNLKHLNLRGTVSDLAFEKLAGLRKLESVSLGGVFSPRCFQTLSALPHLQSIALTGNSSFGQQELDAKTTASIQLLSGRPMKIGLYRGHYPASLIRAVLNVTSLEEFVLWGHVHGVKAEDFAAIRSLEKLKKIEIQLADERLQLSVAEIVGGRDRQFRAASHRVARRKRVVAMHGAVDVQPAMEERPSSAMVSGWIREMSKAGRKYDPAPILVYGDAGLRAMLERIFPETIQHVHEVDTVSLSEQEVQALLKQLGDDRFSVREDAQSRLAAGGRRQASLIEASLKDLNAEARSRCQHILSTWAPMPIEPALAGRDFQSAWVRYLGRQTELASDQLLADKIVEALKARVDKSDRAKLLAASFYSVAQCKDDAIYETFVPLCDHEDVAVPIFVLRNLGGRAGNDYVSPMHKAAIDSKRTELVKAGFSSMPSPVWDRSYKPYLRERLTEIFTTKSDKGIFHDDQRFLRLLAFSAWRDHRIPAAQDFLLNLTQSSNSQIATKALSSFGDAAFFRQPLDKKLLDACRKAIESDSPDLRATGVSVLGTYASNAKAIDLLLHSISDDDENVWQSAVQGVYRQHAWNIDENRKLITAKLATLLRDSLDDLVKARYELTRRVLQNEHRPEWIEVEP